MSMKWTPDYSVEHDEMDEQHQQLFTIINEYYEAVDRKASFADLIKVFDRVLAFTDYHFKEEEEMMERCQFPKLTEHKIIHRTLVERVLELREDLKNQKQGSQDTVKYFLKNWLSSHIKGIDKQYSGYANVENNRAKAS